VKKVRALCANLGVSAEDIIEKCRAKLGVGDDEPPEPMDEWVGRSNAELKEVWGWVKGQGWFEAGQAGGPRDLPAEWIGESPWMRDVLRSVAKVKWSEDDEVVREAQRCMGGDLPWDIEMARKVGGGVSGMTRLEVGSKEAEALAGTLSEDILMGSVWTDEEGRVNARPKRGLSPLFVVSTSGKLRIIHDCRRVNDYLDKASVKFETVHEALQQDIKWACKMDLRAAFKQVPVSKKDAECLGFQIGEEGWKKGLSGEFRTLPLGMGHSPARMVGAMQPAIDAARRMGVRMAWYLDDILVVGATEEEVSRGVGIVVAFLARWGFRISHSKFFPYMCSRIDFLGMLIDFTKGTIGVSKAKQEKLRAEAKRLLELEKVPQ
jgi:hypothetical protein